MTGSAPTDWQWIGPHMSQRMFGITEERARGYAESHGGTASKMEPTPDVDTFLAERQRRLEGQR